MLFTLMLYFFSAQCKAIDFVKTLTAPLAAQQLGALESPTSPIFGVFLDNTRKQKNEKNWQTQKAAEVDNGSSMLFHEINCVLAT